MNLLRLISARQAPPGGFDPDAQAFITAAGITDPTQKTAINQLVLDLKGYSIWSKMKAVYPLVGGTASSHSYNLINVAQFQITWSGSLTHNSDGVTTSATGYGLTGITPSTHLTQNSTHVSTYKRSLSNSGNCYDLVVSDGSYVSALGMLIAYGGTSNLFVINEAPWGAGTFTLNYGMFCASRTTSSSASLYRNGTSTATSGTSVALPAFELPVCGFNVGGSVLPNTAPGQNWAFFSVGDGLDATETANFYTAVQAFQTTLGRQV